MLQFLAVEKKGDRWVATENDDGTPVVFSPLQLSNFREQIGSNTNYIIHPEEILAENFRHLVLGTKSLPNPEIIEKMKRIIETRRPQD